MSADLVQELTEYFRDYVSKHKQELFETILNNRTRHCTVVLENIFQPQNASAVIRTAECYGIQDVHIIENEYEFKTNKNVVLGAAKWLTIHRYDEPGNNSIAAVDSLKRKGYRLIGAHPDPEAIAINKIDITKPFAVFFGTEKTGLTDQVLNNVDELVYIPIYGFTESYNISVSAAIALTVLRQRMEKEMVDFFLSDDEKAELRLSWYKKMVRQADLMEAEFIRNKLPRKN